MEWVNGIDPDQLHDLNARLHRSLKIIQNELLRALTKEIKAALTVNVVA